MGVWNAIECWILQRLVLGIRSSVGTLALPLRPLYSNIRQGWAVKTTPVVKTAPVNTPKSGQYWSTEIFSGWLVLYLVYGSVERT